MNAKEIQLPRKITNQLMHLAQLSPDLEICGLISCKNDLSYRCYPIENTAKPAETRFQLDEKQQISALSSMRDKNEQLFAIYHSHPSAPATPSSTDIKLATYPEAIHLIISLNTKGVLEIRAFNISKGSAEEISLSLSTD